MLKIFFVVPFLLLWTPSVCAQVVNKESYDIRQEQFPINCSQALRTIQSAPPEARFGSEIRGDSVFVYRSDVDWFTKIFESTNDGLAVDLVQREQFQCDEINRFADSWSHRGFLLQPIYRDQIKNTMIVKGSSVEVFVGMLPKAIKKENTEVNYLVLSNKFRCTNTNMVNVNFHGWRLLKTGLFYDTLTPEKLNKKYRDLSKTLRFVIPFEKDKAEYSQLDIKPMYDSLQMTDYAITRLSIQAFTSVEGSYEHNMKLQNKRAQSMIRALQGFQSEQIQSHVTAAENWVEFLSDMKSTGNTSWFTMSKAEIKKRLASREQLNRFEPLLKNHRKAIVEIQLDKRLSDQENDPDLLRKYFEQRIAEKNIAEALHLQNIIFHKIERRELSEEFLDQLDIPEATVFGGLLINEAAFLYNQDYSNVFEAIETFERLDRILPENPKIKYNLCALQLEAWALTPKLVDPLVMAKSVEALWKYGIKNLLIRRLVINYHIILSEIHLSNRNYQEKDKSVDFIYKAYAVLKLNDDDLVNLAKYFSHHSHFDMAEKVLEQRIQSINASEDLIFYYLNLTIFHKTHTAKPSYRSLMLNAVNSNSSRFCDLFLAISQGGVSFQLLDDPFLKKTYCENCNLIK